MACVRDFKELSAEGIGSRDKNKALSSIIMTACWFLWLNCYDINFNNVPVVVQSVLDKIKVHSFLWVRSRPNWLFWCGINGVGMFPIG